MVMSSKNGLIPMAKKRAKKIGYMDKTDFDHELGNALGGNEIYRSIEDLKRHKRCATECGIVKVEVTLLEVVQESTN